MGLYEETMLGDETKYLFRDVADLSCAERERYFPGGGRRRRFA